MKLEFQFIPRTMSGINARNKCPKEQWDMARFACYQRAGYICEVCGQVGPKHPVECHEYWEWNKQAGIQRLVKLIALCPKCHQAVHLGHTISKLAPVRSSGGMLMANEVYLNILLHVCSVNGWTLKQTRANLAIASRLHNERSKQVWKLDVSLVSDFEVQSTRFDMEGFEL